MPTITDKIYYNGYPPVPNDFEPYGPYNSVSSALNQIINVLEAECSGLTFGITDGSNNVTEYWLQPSSTAGQYVVVPKSIPRITSSDANKFLKVNANADGMTWDTVSVTDTNYYPSRSYTSGLQISTSEGVANTCALFVPEATTSQKGVISVGTGLSVSSGAVSIDNSVVALQSDLPEGEINLNLNDTTTTVSSTVALSNIVAGDSTSGYTKYTVPTVYVSSVNGSSGAITNIATTTDLTNKDTIKTQSTGGATSIALKFWQGSQAQYDSITTKDSGTCYLVVESNS